MWAQSLIQWMDDQYYFWSRMVDDITNEHLPVKKMRFWERDAPYITSEWKKAIRQKRKFSRKFTKERSAENWELKKRYRNEATKQRRNSIKEYWQQKAVELKDKPRKFLKPSINS